MENMGMREYTRSTSRGDVYAESNAEYTIPDYNADIRKLIHCEAHINPSGSFAADGDVEFSGVVVYNIMYCDPEGKINSTSFSSDYEYHVKCPEEQYVDALADTRVSSLSVRVIGPRKLSAKASLVSSVTLIEKCAIELCGTAFETGARTEICESEVKIHTTALSEREEREYAEVLASLDGAIADEVRVLYSGADVTVDSVAYSDAAVRVMGELSLFVLVCEGDDTPRLYEKKVEIDQTLNIAGATPDMRFSADATVLSLKDSINATDTGTDVVLSAIVEIRAIGDGNVSVFAVDDAYLTECACDNVYGDFHYTSYLASHSHTRLFEGSAERGAVEIDNLREIPLLVAQPKIEETVISPTEVRVRGEIKFSGVACGTSEDGTPTYSPIKFSTEFNENVKLDCQISDKTRIKPKIHLSHARGYVDAQRVYGEVDMTVDVSAFEDMSHRVIESSEARYDLPFERASSVVSIYYPERGETLFSVAKRFHTTRERIAADNDLSVKTSTGAESLAGVKRLMII